MPELSVNIDHVATVRQARYRGMEPGVGEPDPARAVQEVELAGAEGITIHLREDRRHIQDRDARLIRTLTRIKFNLEMAATDEMAKVAEELAPHTIMLVPEGRMEVTTEGGLDVAGRREHLARLMPRLKATGALVSAFIDADSRQVHAARDLGFDICEVHTGPYAEAFARAGGDMRRGELLRALEDVAIAGGEIRAAGMRFNAGHALNYANVGAIARLTEVRELHIGHAIVSRAVFTGLRQAVADMRGAMRA